MNKIYNRESVNSDLILNRKRSWRYCLALLFGMFLSIASFAQTTIIDPASAGAFEGATFGADGWTVLNNATAGGSWVQSTGATAGFSGSQCAYLTTNTAGTPPPFGYNISGARVSALYRDVTVPSGETSISLSFKWICVGESGYDRLQVWAVPTSYTPLNGTTGIATTGTAPTGRVLLGAGTSGYQSSGSWTTANVVVPAAYAGTTFRLVFQWRNDSSGGSNPPIAVDNVSLTSSCSGAVAIAATTITSSTATANWNAFAEATNYDLRYRIVGSGSWTTLTSLAGTSTSLSSLTSASTYEYQVKANGPVCNFYSTSVSFSTSCNASGMPYFEGFESAVVPAFPLCVSGSHPLTRSTTATGAAPRTGTKYQNISWTPTVTKYIYSAPLAFTSSTSYDMGAWYLTDGGAGWTSIKLFVNTSASPTGATLLTTVSAATNITYQKIAGTYVSPATGTYFFFIEVIHTSGPNNMSIDDMFAEVTPNCVVPTALSSSAVTLNNATLNWTASVSNPANGYDVFYSTTNTAPTAGTTPTVDNHTASPYSATGLTPSSTYYWWVRSDCGAETSSWASGGSFLTPCANITTFPFVESFDATSTTLACWGVSAGAGASINWGVTTADGANGAASPASTARFAFLNVYNAQTAYNTYNIFTPTIELDATAKRLTYNYFLGNGGYTTTPIPLSVLISVNGGAFTSIYGHTTANSTFATASSSPWQLNIIDLSTYAGQTIQLAFVSNSNYGSGITNQGIDQVTIENIPSCLAPTALLADNISFTAADLSWTSDGNSFEVEYGAPGFTLGEGTTESTTTNALVLADLISGASYSYYVRNDCGAIDGNSTWAGPYNFTTLSKASVTWIESFPTSTLPQGWLNGGFITNTVTALTPGTTTNYLYKNLYGSVPNANVQTIYVGDLGANDRLRFSYKLANYGSPYAPPAVDSGNFTLEIQEYPMETWTLVATVSNNGVAGWQEVSYNLSAYAGKIIKARITGNRTAGDYYLGFDNFTIEPTPCPEWTGAVSDVWTDTGNWCDNMVPAVTADVINNSSNPMVISSNVTVNSITLGATAVVTLNGTLNVGDITVAEGGIMTVANDAAVLQTALATNTGMVSVKRISTELFRQDYTLWSSPVSGQNLRAFSPQTLFNRFSSYDTAAGTMGGEYVQEIVTVADMNTKTFTTGDGYLIRMPNNWVQFGGTALSFAGTFTGTLNNGAISVPLSGANTKLNLTGNPYPSPIEIDAFFAGNSEIVDNTLYFWRKKGSTDPLNTGSGYATYSAMGLASADPSISGTMPTNIEVGQGFFVVASSATPGNLVFNNTMRNNGAATFYKGATSTPTELHRMWLNLSNGTNLVGQTLLGYATGATQAVDAGIDAAYFNDSALALTSIIDNSEYIIQGRSLPFVDSDSVPLGFKSDVAGEFTISLFNFDGLFAENQDIFLKDNVTGTVQNLKVSDYTFATPAGVYNTRFEVQYTNSTLGTNNPIAADHAILIGVKDQKITINAGSVVMDKIELIDVAGRVIYTQDGVNATTATLDNVVSANQMLIVRISTQENGVVTQKIIF